MGTYLQNLGAFLDALWDPEGPDPQTAALTALQLAKQDYPSDAARDKFIKDTFTDG